MSLLVRLASAVKWQAALLTCLLAAANAAAATYTLTGNYGSGAGSYEAGKVVDVVAATPPNHSFLAWTGDTAYVADPSAEATTVTMPAQNATVTATFQPKVVVPHALTVNNGSGSGSYTLFSIVTVTANAPEAGKVFSAWTGDTAYVANASAATTTVTMPDTAVTITATYASPSDPLLTVESGSGSGRHPAGALVAISANTPAPGMRFAAWTGDTSCVTDTASSTTTVTMPAYAVTVTATYEIIPVTKYALTVTNGSGSGSYANMKSVVITANAPPVGQRFSLWIGDVAYVNDVSDTQTTVTMPGKDIAVKATYVDIGAASHELTVDTGTGSGSYAAGAQITIRANNAAPGMTFAAWTGDIDHLDSATLSQATVTMPDADVAVVATYKTVPHFFTITASAGTGGVIAPAGQVEVDSGASQSFAITPDTGYQIADVLVDGISAGQGSSYVFENVVTDRTITAIFSKNVYSVTFAADVNGSISGDTEQTVVDGADCSTVRAVANSGCHFVNWSGGYSGADNPLTIKNVSGDMAVFANFASGVVSHTVTFAADVNGSISGDTEQTVVDGANCSAVTAVPQAGYRFVSWTGDYSGAANPLTVTDVTKDIVITANFVSVGTYVVKFVAGSHGSILGELEQSVVDGSDCSPDTAVAELGYHFVSWTVGDTETTENPLTVKNVAKDMTVTANFAVDTHTVTFVAATGGALVGTTTQAVDYGTACSPVTAVPDTGYHFDSWTGGYSGTANPLTVVNVTTDMTVVANFIINTHTVTFAATTGGALVGTTAQTVDYGSACTVVSAVPDTGYHFDSWTGDYSGTANPLTVTNVTKNMNITANFAVDTHIVTFTAATGGALAGTTTQTVNYGAACSPVTAVPDTGYHFDSWTGGYSGTANPLTVTNVTADMSITANFAVDTHIVTFTATTGGTLTGTTTQTVNYGAACSPVTAVPDTGHHFDRWTGDHSGTANPLTVTNVTADMSITANFAVDTHIVTFAAATGGALTGTTTQTVNYGAACSPVTAVPDTGYQFDKWTGDYSGAANPLTVTNVTADMSVTANFVSVVVTHSVTFMAGVHGSIVGDTEQVVIDGSDCSPDTAVADVGYHFVSWTLGDTETTENPLTVKNVTSDLVATAHFAIDTHTVTFMAGLNGSVVGDTEQVVNYGSDCVPVNAAADVGYHFISWTLGDTETTENPLTVRDVTGNLTATAHFAIDTHTVKFTAGLNGSLSGDTDQIVRYGEDCSAVVAKAASGYHFDQWGGSYVGTVNPLIVTNVTKDMVITASFADGNAYTVVFAAGDHGSIAGTLFQTVIEGADCDTVVAEPDSPYYFDKWDGGVDSVDTALQVKNVTKDMVVTANFVDQQPIHVAPGSVFTLNLTTALYKKPTVVFKSVSGSKANVKVLTNSKDFKSVDGVTALKCQWTSTSKSIPPQSDGSLYLDKAVDPVTKYCTIEQPSTISMTPASGSGAVKPADTVLVKGMFFGSKCPKVYMTYSGQDKPTFNCKVGKPNQADANDKPNKSYMDVNTGYSELTFTVPKKITTGTAATVHIKFNFTDYVIPLEFNAQ